MLFERLFVINISSICLSLWRSPYPHISETHWALQQNCSKWWWMLVDYAPVVNYIHHLISYGFILICLTLCILDVGMEYDGMIKTPTGQPPTTTWVVPHYVCLHAYSQTSEVFIFSEKPRPRLMDLSAPPSPRPAKRMRIRSTSVGLTPLSPPVSMLWKPVPTPSAVWGIWSKPETELPGVRSKP